jgi:hypothetical protein
MPGGSGLFTLFFLIVLGVILYQVVRQVMRSREIGQLEQSGKRIAANVTNVVHERVQTNMGQPPNPATHMPATAPTYRDDWFVEAQWTDPQTGREYAFKSDRLDREDAIRYAAGDPITVMIDPVDPDRYYVELAR